MAKRIHVRDVQHAGPSMDLVYIGRPRWADSNSKNTHYGNPFVFDPQWLRPGVHLVKDREAAVQAYKNWLDGCSNYQDLEPQRRDWILSQIPNLCDKILVCFCNGNEVCHGDVLLEKIKAFQEQEKELR